MPRYKNRKLPSCVCVIEGLVYVRMTKPRYMESFGKADIPGNIDRAIAKRHQIKEQHKKGYFKEDETTQRILFNDLVEECLKHKPEWRDQLVALRRFLDRMYFDEVNYFKLRPYRDWRKTQRAKRSDRLISDSTVNRELAILSAMYNLVKLMLDEQELKPIVIPKTNPVTVLRKKDGWYDERESRRRTVLSDNELKLLIEVSTPRFQRYCMTALNTALRKKDVLALSRSSFDSSTNQIEGIQHKVGTAYLLPNNGNLQKLVESSGEKLVEGVNFRREYRESRDAFVKAGGRHFWLTDIRRTALMKVWDKTKDLVLCMAMAGHTNSKTTMRYLGITHADIQRAGRVLEEAFPYSMAESSPKIGFKSQFQTVSKTVSNKLNDFQENDETSLISEDSAVSSAG